MKPITKSQLVRPRSVLPPVGSYQEAWVEAWKEAKRIEDQAKEQPELELTAIYRLGSHAFAAASHITEMSRGKTAPTPQEFVKKALFLRAILPRFKAYSSSKELVRWPRDPGITFSWKAGDSALDLAYIFAGSIEAAVAIARAEACQKLGLSINADALDMLNLAAPTHRIFEQWRDDAATELNTRALQPPGEWTIAMVKRDSQSHLRKLAFEFEKALASTTPESSGKALKGKKAICAAIDREPHQWRWLTALSKRTQGPLHKGQPGKLYSVPDPPREDQ